MSDNVLTVKQEVEVLLRAARETAQSQIDHIATFNVPGVADFHDGVLHDLDKIIEAYVNPPAAEVATSRGFNIGDKVVITGASFSREYHGVQAGDVVEIAEEGDGEFGWREAKFEVPYSAWWYIYSENIPYDEGGTEDEFDRWGGRLLTAEEQEIKVGDTVRILPLYDESVLTPGLKTSSGVEFEVTEVIWDSFAHGRFEERADTGLTSRFFVKGDPDGRGVWEAFIEKVYK